MNEKIKELYEQARVTPSYSSDGFLPRYLFEEEELAKFAELIIKECADACYKHKDVESFGIYPVRVAMVTKACSDNIKEHFGVEE